MTAKGEKVTLAMCFGSFEPECVVSLTRLTQYDLTVGGHHLDHKHSFLYVGTTNIASGRNNAVRAFLEGDSDWLLFLDTDEAWDPDLIDRLMASADAELRPVLSGLIMARRERDMPISPACVILDDHKPPRPIRPSFVPHVRHWPVMGVGAGCLLMHRSVLEKIRDEFAEREPREWFEYVPWTWTKDDGTVVKDEMGEDYTFSVRCHKVGVQPYVDTTITLDHIKSVALTREMFVAQQPRQQTFVIIPVKDKLEFTRPLVESLREQGGYDGLLIYDNGSGAETKEWLKAQPDVLAFDARGAGIHDMWNAGADYALRFGGPTSNLIFLNNDITISHNFCAGLVSALRDGPWMAVSPNYDERKMTDPVERVSGICAERYDGTGGLSGFAFAVRAELFAQGYAFPTDAKWWFGDNDLTLTMDQSGLAYGIAADVACTHIGAGTAEDWQAKKWSKQLAADQAAFMRKWGQAAA